MEMNFANGIWIKTISTKYGDMVKTKIKIKAFLEWAKQHIDVNGEIKLETKLSKKTGEPYTVVDNWKPDANYKKPQQQQINLNKDEDDGLPF